MDMTLVGILALGACYLFLAFTRQRPTNLGVKDGRLARCAPTPNCVATQAEPDDEQHFIEPFRLTGPAEEAITRVKGIVLGLKGAKVVQETPDYLYAEIAVPWTPLVDDVEFWADAKSGVIHFRSAARRGYGDLGVNRRRMEKIRSQLNAGST